MKRRKFLQASSLTGAGLWLAPNIGLANPLQPLKDISVGIIGLDTSHSPAFAKILNTAGTGFKVTHAYPHGSRDIESSTSRIPRYTEELKGLGVSIAESLDELLSQVDAVLLETNDGRRHLEQAEAVFKAGKKMFIDKPMAASLEDVIRIFALAEQYRIPTFSASSLRFGPSTMAVRGGKIGKVTGADVYSPCTLEETHPDLFWYGIHGVESLYTVMGTGCQTVRRIHQEGMDIVIGEWADGRVGTFRGIRDGKTGYGGTAFGTEGIAPAGVYEGYEPLVQEIMQFFKTDKSPIPQEETIEIFAFMAAADESKQKGGKAVSVEKVLAKARKRAGA